jgi:hypothetical protein
MKFSNKIPQGSVYKHFEAQSTQSEGIGVICKDFSSIFYYKLTIVDRCKKTRYSKTIEKEINHT